MLLAAVALFRTRSRVWELLGVSRRLYEAARPWEAAGLSRRRYERLMRGLSPEELRRVVRRGPKA